MLTQKQEKFVQELIKGKSQREAYKASYNAANMKDTTIDSKASRLFQKDTVRARFDELNGAAVGKSGDDAASVRALIIDTEIAIIKANIGEIYKVEHEVDSNGDKVAVVRPRTQAEIDAFDMRAVQEMRIDSKGRPIFKLYDKQNAINTLREIFGIGNEMADNEINVFVKTAEGYDE